MGECLLLLDEVLCMILIGLSIGVGPLLASGSLQLQLGTYSPGTLSPEKQKEGLTVRWSYILGDFINPANSGIAQLPPFQAASSASLLQ